MVSLFFNALTANHKHYLLNRDNLTQEIQIRFSERHETFPDFFFSFFEFLKFTLNFKHN